MELLPIIYISVGIFTIIFVVILIVSYFSYKVRKFTGNGDKEEEILLELKPQQKNGKKDHEKKKASAKPKKKEEKSKKHEPTKSSKTGEKKNKFRILNTGESGDKAKKSSDKKATYDDILQSYSDDEDKEFFKVRVRKKKK